MFDENIIRLMNKWAAESPTGLEPALRICRELISFRCDPLEKEKQERRKKNPFDLGASLDPAPRFRDWEYSRLLEKAVRPLAAAAPLRTAKLLIEVVAEMMRFDTGREPDEVDTEKNDASEIWSPRVDEQRRPYAEPKGDLVRVLTFASEQVYERKDVGEIEQLDKALRYGKWYVFDRVRYHLYVKSPAQARTWICDAIVSYPSYSEEQYGFEFQRMIRTAAEQFGAEMLSREDLTRIFDEIMRGPDKQADKAFMAERFTEEGFQRRQEYFQHRQLAPFAPVLFGKYLERFNELASRLPALTDEDFVRYDIGESKTGATRSPKSAAELALLSDDELIAFLNDWDDPHQDSDKWWVDVDFVGLATAFQQLIVANPQRFLAWGERWRAIERPIYVRYALNVATKRVGQHQPELDQWLDIANWVMTKPDDPVKDDEKASETSRDRPAWNSARTEVVALIAECVKKDAGVGIEWRPRLITLLKVACLCADRYLDSGRPIITPRNFLTDAINTMRGRALETLLQYGSWVKRQQHDADISDLFEVLELRLAGSPPLTLPEYALLGASFHQLYDLSSSWARAHVGEVFPQEKTDAWAAGVEAYLRFNSPHPLVFGILIAQLEFAIEHMRLFKDEENSRNDAIEHLGEHLLNYYLLGLLELSGSNSLLARFYRKTKPKYWAHVFDYLGRMLSKTKQLKAEIAERCKEFFEARLAAGNAEELQELTFWLMSECLSPNWRVNALLRTLDVTKSATRTPSMIIEELAKLLKHEPDLVVSAFAMLTDYLVGRPYFYLQPEYVKPILKHGFASENEATVHAAKLAQDNLLKAGRSEFRDLDAIPDNVQWN
jgi:hypothetical protein